MLKIYKIVDNTNGNIYIGKTTLKLNRRLMYHKNNLNCMSREIIKNGDYKIELIEETNDINRERYWIINTECINKIIPNIVIPSKIKIYKIIDNTNGTIYIGKTTQTLKKRLSNHKNKKCCMSREIIKNGDYKIELIEETDDETRERYWIENTECINKYIPGRTSEEWNEDNKDKMIAYKEKYYNNNKQLCKKRAKEYYKNNIEQISEYNKKRQKIRNNWMASMGGRPTENNNSLIKIDPNLFLI